MIDPSVRWIAISSQRLGARSWQGVVHLRDVANQRNIESRYCKHRHQSRETATRCAERRLPR